MFGFFFLREDGSIFFFFSSVFFLDARSHATAALLAGRQQGILSCSIGYERISTNAGDTSAAAKKLAQDAADHHKAAAGALGVAILVNFEAEAAELAVATAHRAHDDRKEDARLRRIAAAERANRERADTLRETAVMGQEDHPARPQTPWQDTDAGHDDDAIVLAEEYDQTAYEEEANASCGVDQASGLPWRYDEHGYRRFFLGFPIPDDDS